MQSISTKFFFSSKNRMSSLDIPLLNKGEIKNIINIFIQTRPIKKKPNKGLNRQRILVKDLFQKKDKELFVFPHTHCIFLTEFNINKNLILLHKSHNNGIVICFVPADDTVRACFLNKEIFIQENPLESLQDAEFLSLSRDVVSVFCFEGGWINQRSDGQFVLQGIEIMVLQTKGMQCLLCKKVEIEPSAPERPLQHHPVSPLPRNSKFIKLPCFCRCKGFSFKMTLPVLTSSDLRIELKNSHREEWNSLSYPQEENFFNTEETRHQAICFPDGMEMDFPFCGVKGWQLFFSFTEKANHFLCVFLPKISESSTLKTHINKKPFCKWQTGISHYFQKVLCQMRPYCFNISQMSLIQKDGLEYCVKGGDVKLVSKETTGMWGMLFSRQQKDDAYFFEKKEAIKTATTSSFLSPARDSIEPQEKSSRKRLHPFQTPFVELPPSKKDTSLLQPSPPPFSKIEASPLTTLQPLVASMVQLHGNVERLEPLQLPPLPFHEPARSWQQQEDVFTDVSSLEKMLTLMDETKEEKEKELQKKSFEGNTPVSSFEEMLALMDETKEEKEKELQKKSFEGNTPVSSFEEMLALMDETKEEKEKELQKKSSEGNNPAISLEEMLALMDETKEEKEKELQKKSSEGNNPVISLEEMLAFMHEAKEKKSS